MYQLNHFRFFLYEDTSAPNVPIYIVMQVLHIFTNLVARLSEPLDQLNIFSKVWVPYWTTVF